MKILRLCATLFSLGLAGVGLLGVAFPTLLLEFAQSLLLPPALYGVAVVRVAFGVLLVVVAAGSRMPRTLRAVGAFIVVAGLVTPFAGVLPFDETLNWFSTQSLGLFRFVAMLPMMVGIVLAFAINPARHASGDGAV
ncbi:hypothetical protein [Ramlibacter sp. AN1133]|uniref:hypothetical protein n=1 Tax=Ramlibacter sp. AN1133 TaxID=3133429 RepID=UPI0030BFF2F2